jgi:hypothetical protein
VVEENKLREANNREGISRVQIAFSFSSKAKTETVSKRLGFLKDKEE